MNRCEAVQDNILDWLELSNGAAGEVRVKEEGKDSPHIDPQFVGTPAQVTIFIDNRLVSTSWNRWRITSLSQRASRRAQCGPKFLKQIG